MAVAVGGRARGTHDEERCVCSPLLRTHLSLTRPAEPSLLAGLSRREYTSSDPDEYALFVGELDGGVDDALLCVPPSLTRIRTPRRLSPTPPRRKRAFTGQFASCTTARVMVEHGRSCGYGFVRFAIESERDAALRAMDGQRLGSKAMRCVQASKTAGMYGPLSKEDVQKFMQRATPDFNAVIDPYVCFAFSLRFAALGVSDDARPPRRYYAPYQGAAYGAVAQPQYHASMPFVQASAGYAAMQALQQQNKAAQAAQQAMAHQQAMAQQAAAQQQPPPPPPPPPPPAATAAPDAPKPPGFVFGFAEVDVNAENELFRRAESASFRRGLGLGLG